MVRKVGLLNHMGGGNLGDDATQAAVIQNIKSRWPEAEIFGFSMNPSDTEERHRIPSYPIRTETWSANQSHVNSSATVGKRMKRFLRKFQLLTKVPKSIKALTSGVPRVVFEELTFLCRSHRVIRSFDLLIISGGGQLLDSWGGPWKFPYTVFKWTLLAKLSGVKCFFLNVGAGPLNNPLAKWFVTSALSHADYISFRDEDSRSLVQRIGFKGKGHISADCVYALDLSVRSRLVTRIQEEPTVGLSPMAYCDPRVYWKKDRATYERFIRNLASFGSWLGENRYLLTLFSTDIFFDSQTIEDLKASLANPDGNSPLRRIRHERIVEIDGLLSQMYSMDYIVTCRFHGVVFAHLLNKPVLALSHHPKVSTLMNDLGLSRYCVDIASCDVDVLKETFQSLVVNRDEIQSRMAEKLACYRKSLSIQFDQLFPRATKI